MKVRTQAVAVLLSVLCIFAFVCPMVAFADGEGGTSLDDLSGQSTGQNTTQTGSTSDSSGQSDSGKAIEDYLRGYTPVTGENMEQASSVASPIVSAIGTISGFIVMVVSAGIFLVTALDLCYIGLPFMRGILNPQYAAAVSGGGAMGGAMPMGGMGMGRMGMMGGGMMGGFGAPVQTGEHGLRRKWVSDEAVYCVQIYALGGQQQGGAMGAMPMGGMGMGAMGMGAMGAMGAAGAQQPAMPMKSVIGEYLKKRSFFLILFAIATVILMSSVFTDCGLNLAQLITKIINKFSGQVVNVNI